MANPVKGYRPGMGTSGTGPAGNVPDGFIPYTYGGTGPFDTKRRAGGHMPACGTITGYNRHVYDGTTICAPCQTAHDDTKPKP